MSVRRLRKVGSKFQSFSKLIKAALCTIDGNFPGRLGIAPSGDVIKLLQPSLGKSLPFLSDSRQIFIWVPQHEQEHPRRVLPVQKVHGCLLLGSEEPFKADVIVSSLQSLLLHNELSFRGEAQAGSCKFVSNQEGIDATIASFCANFHVANPLKCLIQDNTERLSMGLHVRSFSIVTTGHKIITRLKVADSFFRPYPINRLQGVSCGFALVNKTKRNEVQIELIYDLLAGEHDNSTAKFVFDQSASLTSKLLLPLDERAG